MNGLLDWLSVWLVDFSALATAILALSLVLRCVTAQPATRVALAWGTWLAVATVAVVAALPAWPRYGLDSIAHAWERPEVAIAGEPKVQLLPEEPPVAVAAADAPAPIMSPPPRLVEVIPPASEAPSLALRELAAVGWLAAAVLGLSWIVVGSARTRRLLTRARDVPDWVRDELQRIIGGKSRKAVPGLWSSERVHSAVALGAVRPQIVLPRASVVEANRLAVRAALAHEWAHIRHGDLWLLALERLLVPLLAWHPLFWWLRRAVRLDQELLADAAAAGEERVEYAEALLAWAQSAQGPASRPLRHGLAAIGMWENPNTLSRRITMILDPKRRVAPGVSRAWILALAMLLVPAVAGLSLVTLRPLVAQEEAPDLAPAAEVPPPPRHREAPGPLPREATVPVTKIELELLVLDVDRQKLAAADTTLEDAIAEATESRCRREAGLIVSDIAAEEVAVLLEALQKHKASQVVSRPRVITLDGREARVHIGGEAPILRVEETINGRHERRVEYQEFGTLLMVRPKLNVQGEVVTLDILAEQASLLPPGEKAEEGAAARDVPGLVSHKFKLTTEVKLGGSLLVAESPGKKQQPDAAKQQFLLIVTPQRAVRQAAAVYADPAAGNRAEKRRQATEAAIEAATAAEPEPGTAAAALLKGEREKNAALQRQIEALRQELAERAESGGIRLPAAARPAVQEAEQRLMELDLAEAKLALVAAERDFARIEQLGGSKVVSRQEIDQKKLALDLAQIQVQRAMAKLQAVSPASEPPAKPPTPQASESNSIEVRLLELDLAEAKLAVAEAEARLENVAMVRAKNPGALGDQDLRTSRLNVERAKIQLQRVMVKLEAAKQPRPQAGR